jgi:hypothetical protein
VIAPWPTVCVTAGLLALAAAGCGGGAEVEPDASPRFDAAIAGDADAVADTSTVDVPRFSTALYFDLDHVERISRFRSGLGHDFADSYESCRSMKHYFCPTECMGTWPHTTSWTELPVYSPADGSITRLEAEQTFGTQAYIRPEGLPTWEVRVFHVTPLPSLMVGNSVAAGQLLGHHAADETMSDIAVQQLRDDGFRLVSFFDTLTDEAFAPLLARGVASRGDLIIGADERDAAPLACDGEVFADPGAIENWLVLDPP